MGSEMCIRDSPNFNQRGADYKRRRRNRHEQGLTRILTLGATMSMIPVAEGMHNHGMLALGAGGAAGLSVFALMECAFTGYVFWKAKEVVDHTAEGAADVVSVVTAATIQFVMFLEDATRECYKHFRGLLVVSMVLLTIVGYYNCLLYTSPSPRDS